jgi:hypothetical protein
MYLSAKASKARQREAENARRNRMEVVRARSIRQITRRDLFRWGLLTAGGALAWKHGLNPYVPSKAYAAIPTGFPRSPLFGVQAFTQPLLRFDVLPRHPAPFLNPAPTREANTTQQLLNPALEGVRFGDTGPIEGRPPGPIWAHQRFEQFPPKIHIEVSQEGAKTNTTYNPGVPSSLNSGVNPATPIPLKFHPGLPTQAVNSVWTFNGTVPPKLVIARYGEPIIFRHHNKLPFDVAQNNGFGRHPISTHEHNGHHGAENDGFTGAYFFPGQFYDYHWPIVLGGHFTFNTQAQDRQAGTPDGSGHITQVPGDWRETMSTHWFHDHMFSFTSENVYKGNAGMMNIYSALDRGNEAINDGVNLQLPSGRTKDFGNLDYDVNLMLADKTWDQDGQLVFDIFDRDGFLGDAITVNLVQAILRGRAAQVPLPHPERGPGALLQDRAERRLADDSDRQRRRPAPAVGAAERPRPAGGGRALRHRHRLLPLQHRPEGVDGEPGRARHRQEGERRAVVGPGPVRHLARSRRGAVPRVPHRAEPVLSRHE